MSSVVRGSDEDEDQDDAGDDDDGDDDGEASDEMRADAHRAGDGRRCYGWRMPQKKSKEREREKISSHAASRCCIVHPEARQSAQLGCFDKHRDRADVQREVHSRDIP